MPHKNTEEIDDAKVRIIKASEQLFSEKGFDATRVDEIAEAAHVNKALIYYYFKSKEDILDYVMQSLFTDIVSNVMDFVHCFVVEMINDGRLDIESDRWRFADEETLVDFLHNLRNYYERLIDFVLERRRTIRIIVFESLKNSKHHYGLFRLLDLMDQSDNNPIYKTIWDADKDFTYSSQTVVVKFFFGFIPLVNFAAYFDDYISKSTLCEQELRDSFLRFFQVMLSPLVSGRDIWMLNANTEK